MNENLDLKPEGPPLPIPEATQRLQYASEVAVRHSSYRFWLTYVFSAFFGVIFAAVLNDWLSLMPLDVLIVYALAILFLAAIIFFIMNLAIGARGSDEAAFGIGFFIPLAVILIMKLALVIGVA